MRIYLFSLTIFFSITCFCQEKNLIEIRSCFKSIEGVNEIKKLINLSKNSLNNPVILAYNYTGKLMMLDYSNNPFEKYKIFKTKTKQIQVLRHYDVGGGSTGHSVTNIFCVFVCVCRCPCIKQMIVMKTCVLCKKTNDVAENICFMLENTNKNKQTHKQCFETL